jgi:hypothetical protein
VIRSPAVGDLTPATTSGSSSDTFDDLCSTVRICRDHPSDLGQRQVVVSLDRQPSIQLLFGESVKAEVDPGRHHLRVHNTLFWKNITFSIEPGEHLEFIVINRARWWTAGMAGLLGAAPLFLTVIRRSLQ